MKASVGANAGDHVCSNKGETQLSRTVTPAEPACGCALSVDRPCVISRLCQVRTAEKREAEFVARRKHQHVDVAHNTTCGRGAKVRTKG